MQGRRILRHAKPLDCTYDPKQCQPIKSDNAEGYICAHCHRYISAEQNAVLVRERRPARGNQSQPI